MRGNPEDHHPDCDYRNSSFARETEELFDLPERTDVFDCNLGCLSAPTSRGLDRLAFTIGGLS